MSSKSQRLLTIGDTPGCSFLSWRLAQVGWQVTLVCSNSCNVADKTISWRSENLGNGKYTAVECIQSISEIGKVFNGPKQEPFDIILLGVSSVKDLKLISTQIQNIVNKNTLIFVDSFCAIRLEHELKKSMSNKNVPIFAIICDAEVRIVNNSAFKGYQHSGHNTTTVIGTTSETDNNVNNALKGIGFAGHKLNEICDSLKSAQVLSCYLVPKGINPTFTNYAWKKIIPFVVFEGLILIFRKLNPNDVLIAPVLKGTFMNVMTVAKSAGALDLPDPSDTAKTTAYFEDAVKEFNHKHPENLIGPATSRENRECSLKSALAYYNFCHGFETYVELSMMQILLLADDYKIKLPYVESVLSFYKVCEAMNGSTLGGKENTSTRDERKQEIHAQPFEYPSPPVLQKPSFPNQVNTPPGYAGKYNPLQQSNNYQQQRQPGFPYQTQFAPSPLASPPPPPQTFSSAHMARYQSGSLRGDSQFQQQHSANIMGFSAPYNPSSTQNMAGYGSIRSPKVQMQAQTSSSNSVKPLSLQQSAPNGSASPQLGSPDLHSGSNNSPPITSVPSAFPHPFNIESIPLSLAHHPRFDTNSARYSNPHMRSSPSQTTPNIVSSQQSPAELRDTQMNMFRNGNVKNAFDPRGNRYGDVDSFSHNFLMMDQSNNNNKHSMRAYSNPNSNHTSGPESN